MSDSQPSQDGRTRGRFVVIVGPDGVGKSTVARVLLGIADQRTGYFHFRPPMSRVLPEGPPEEMDPAIDKGSAGGSVVMGWVRLVRNLVRFWVGYLVSVRPAVRSGLLVVGDRWAYGYLVQPLALKFYGPPSLARLALRLMPQPDLVVNLTAPVETIHARKQELTPHQIEVELAAWAGLPARNLKSFDTQGTPEQTVAEIRLELT